MYSVSLLFWVLFGFSIYIYIHGIGHGTDSTFVLHLTYIYIYICMHGIGHGTEYNRTSAEPPGLRAPFDGEHFVPSGIGSWHRATRHFLALATRWALWVMA